MCENGSRFITVEDVAYYKRYLISAERAPATIEKYICALHDFIDWLDGAPVSRERIIAWKTDLQQKWAPVTVNGRLSALNGFTAFMGWPEYRIRFLRVQRRIFRCHNRELTKQEYERLLSVARARRQNELALLMETICATGIRVSEVKYITVEAAQCGMAEITLKGKIRTILLPSKLSRKLCRFAREQKIKEGPIFLNKEGNPTSRSWIWAQMKSLCGAAGVAKGKVFPHNLRHLFARIYYKECRDIVQLADVLGHSSIETTRLYLISTGEEYIRRIEKLGLVS